VILGEKLIRFARPTPTGVSDYKFDLKQKNAGFKGLKKQAGADGHAGLTGEQGANSQRHHTGQVGGCS
jgi:hypothetical protein